MTNYHGTMEAKIIDRLSAQMLKNRIYPTLGDLREVLTSPKPGGGQQSFPYAFIQLGRKEYIDSAIKKQTIRATYTLRLVDELMAREEAMLWLYQFQNDLKALLASNPHLANISGSGKNLAGGSELVHRIWTQRVPRVDIVEGQYSVLDVDIGVEYDELLETALPSYTWDVTYPADALPPSSTPAWTRAVAGPGVLVESASGGILNVRTNANGSIYYTRIETAPTTFTIVFRAKAIDAGSTVAPFHGRAFTSPNWLAFEWNAGVKKFATNRGVSPQRYALDWTAYHIYRLTFTGSGSTWAYNVYVDESDTPVISSSAVNVGGIFDSLGFGTQGVAGTNAEFFIDYFKYSTKGAYKPSDLPS